MTVPKNCVTVLYIVRKGVGGGRGGGGGYINYVINELVKKGKGVRYGVVL